MTNLAVIDGVQSYGYNKTSFDKLFTVMNNAPSIDYLNQPMFFGESMGIARFDEQKYPIFEKLTEQQLSYFWRPEEVDLTNERKQFQDLDSHEQHIFTSNLKYQSLMDSIQGRAIMEILLPIVSLPELESWFQTWAFSETIHSRSYTHIIRSIYDSPKAVLDGIMATPEIRSRSSSITKDYDMLYNLIFSQQATTLELKKSLLGALVTAYALEAIRFYVSFACTFAFAERGKMEGNAKIVKLICRDELLHKTGTKHMLNTLLGHREGDNDYRMLWEKHQAEFRKVFELTAREEMEWASYLFKDGEIIGLNQPILIEYLMFITNDALKGIGMDEMFSGKEKNPLPWMRSWTSSDNVQVAPQETEISSYLTSAVNTDVDTSSVMF